MNWKRIAVGSLVGGLVLCSTSCINEDFDLSKEIDMTVQVGTNFTLPIGTTDTVRLDDMITENEWISAIDGRYVVTASGNVTEAIEAVEEVIIEEFVPDIAPYERAFVFTDEYPELHPELDVPPIDVALEVDVSLSEEFTVDFEVPAEVKSVSYVKVTDYNYKEIEALLKLDITNVPEFVHVLHLIGANLTFPDVLDFEIQEVEGKRIQEGSVVHFSEDIYLKNGEGHLTIPVKVKGMKNPDIKDGVLTISDEVGFDGRFYVDERNVNVADLEDKIIRVAPKIEMPTSELRVTEVSGTAVPDIDLNTTVSLDDLPEILQGDGTELGLRDLSLSVSVDNPINAVIEGDVVLSAKDAQGQQLSEPVELSLALGAGSRTDITFHEDSYEINGETYSFKSGSLLDLVRVIPDHFDVSVPRLVVDCKTPEQSIVLGASNYNISVDYDLDIPLEFDNLSLSYTDTIVGLQDDLKDIIDKIDCIEVYAQVTHTIPVNLKLRAYPLDAAGNEISGISLPEAIAIEAAPDSEGTERVSEVDILLEETREGALEELDQLYIVVEGENAEGQGVTLRPDQYLLLDMSVRLPNGIKVDLNEL